jgi:hypothetical protein
MKKTFLYHFAVRRTHSSELSSISHLSTAPIHSRGQKKVGQCFFANVNLLALSMVTMKIFIYYSNPGLLNSILAKFLNKTCPTFFVRGCIYYIQVYILVSLLAFWSVCFFYQREPHHDYVL